MGKIITFFTLSLLLSLFVSSCGASKHSSKCDAYGSLEKNDGDFAKK